MAVRLSRRTRGTDIHGRTVWLPPGDYVPTIGLADTRSGNGDWIYVTLPDGQVAGLYNDEPGVEIVEEP